MLEVYAFATPNSVRIPIALEELGLPYELKSVNVRKGEQKTAAFLALNPNSKVPVLVDTEGANGRPFVLTESGAILIYLAEKTGKLLPAHGAGRYRVFEQILFHGTGIGPSFGQAGYFQRQAPEVVPFAIERFRNEAARTMRVLDGVLGSSAYVAGDEYTIADIAHFGWMWRREFANVEFTETPNIARWYERMMARPAVIRAIERVTALAE
ncbi:glutathione S-transferase N-terminal domain-containing protein [Herbaspirillum rhizosphaerae]|uniref:Glutathione S-transferase N-terminal domain-containing protein n=1 Tax=Herbaspirillum rhizosphaerae TaxID=346179 RepID=A0ABW8ZD56_9BURK